MFVVFELSFEAKVGTYFGSAFSNEGDGLFEAQVVLLHEIGDDKSG